MNFLKVDSCLQVLQVDVEIKLCSQELVYHASINNVPRQTFGVRQEKQWDVRRVGDSIFITSHNADGSRRACLQKFDMNARLENVIKSRSFSEPNMIAVDH